HKSNAASTTRPRHSHSWLCAGFSQTRARKSAWTIGSAQGTTGRSFPKRGSRVYSARNCGNQNENLVEAMFSSSKRLNPPALRRRYLAFLYAGALLFGSFTAVITRAQDRAVAYAPADIRYGSQIYAAQC